MKKKYFFYYLASVFYFLSAILAYKIDVNLYIGESKHQITQKSNIDEFQDNIFYDIDSRKFVDITFIVNSLGEEIYTNEYCQDIRIDYSFKGNGIWNYEYRYRNYFLNENQKIKKLKNCSSFVNERILFYFDKSKNNSKIFIQQRLDLIKKHKPEIYDYFNDKFNIDLKNLIYNSSKINITKSIFSFKYKLFIIGFLYFLTMITIRNIKYSE